jgi:hypothetical protein
MPAPAPTYASLAAREEGAGRAGLRAPPARRRMRGLEAAQSVEAQVDIP